MGANDRLYDVVDEGDGGGQHRRVADHHTLRVTRRAARVENVRQRVSGGSPVVCGTNDGLLVGNADQLRERNSERLRPRNGSP